MQKLVLGSGLSLVLLGGAMTTQAQSDPKLQDTSTDAVNVQEEQNSTAPDTTSQTPKAKFDGIDGEAQDRAKGYLKIGDIKGESQDARHSDWKIEEGIKSPAPNQGRPFLKIGDIQGESQSRADPLVKIDPIPGETKAKFDGIDGEAQDRAKGYLKIGDIKGESQDARHSDWKIEEGIKSPAPNQARPFLKIGDIKGESQDTGNSDWKVEEGTKSPAPNKDGPTFKITYDADVAPDKTESAEEQPR